MKELTLEDIAQITGGTLYAEPSIKVSKVMPLERATQGHVTFLSDEKYVKELLTTTASLVMLPAKYQDLYSGNKLIVEDSYVAFAKVAQAFDPTPRAATGIAPSAVIDASVQMGENVAIGANAVIESGVVLGDNVSIGAGSVIGQNVQIGNNTQLWANVTLYHEVIIGDDCLIHSGAVIGSDGFGNANERGEWIKIPQIGTVRIGNRVEIGAATCIDRGTLDDTVIEDNVVIDNLLQIAHNVRIGYGTAMAGGTVVGGSTTIGKYCMIGGASVLNGHIDVADGCLITGMGMVMRSLTKKDVYSSGIPLQTNKQWRKTAALVHRISDINSRVKWLEKLVKENKS